VTQPILLLVTNEKCAKRGIHEYLYYSYMVLGKVVGYVSMFGNIALKRDVGNARNQLK
jgi:hypothetical protein